MGELTIGQVIKIILGVFVVVAVVVGLYLVFRDKIIDFFRNLPAGEPSELVLCLLK